MKERKRICELAFKTKLDTCMRCPIDTLPPCKNYDNPCECKNYLAQKNIREEECYEFRKVAQKKRKPRSTVDLTALFSTV